MVSTDRDCTTLATVAAKSRRWSLSVKRSSTKFRRARHEKSGDADLQTVALGNGNTPESPPLACPRCANPYGEDATYREFKICAICGFHDRETARATILRLTDSGSFREQDSRLSSTDPLQFEDESRYRERLLALRSATGESDALVSGVARLGGHDIAIAAFDFAFLGGSMGVVVGEKLVRIAERAGERQLPLVTIAASGGARMQEGMFSLLQMAKTSAAIERLKRSGCLYISMLTHPTTGGVFASFANLGDLILAEPGALIGFAGPRVAEQIIGRKLPDGSHTAEFLVAHGMIDATVDRREQRAFLNRALTIVAAPRSGYERRGRRSRTAPSFNEIPAWDTVQRARSVDRLTSGDYLQRMLGDFIEVHGDRVSGDDPAIVAGLATITGKAIAVIAMERGHGDDRARRHEGRPLPEGYRKARRLMEIAERLHLPLLTLIDTPGAYPGIESEERGLASELAGSLARMSTLRTPIVSAVIGEGGSGGALALAVADRVLMQEGAIYSVIAPEGAATILYRNVDRASEISSKLKLTAHDLKRLAIIDEIVPEPPDGTSVDPQRAAELLAASIANAFSDLQRMRIDRVVTARYDRYQRFGRGQAKRIRRRFPMLRRSRPIRRNG